jgi:hypothetical protein
MVMQVRNLRQFLNGVVAERARLEGSVTKKYQQFVTKVFKDLVSHTPQWSGHLAANWHVLTTNETTPGVYPWKVEDYSRPVFQMGDPAAVNFALDNARPKIKSMRWNTKITFANPVPYASEVENDPDRLRPVNLVSGQVVLARYIAQKYSRGNVLLDNR